MRISNKYRLVFVSTPKAGSHTGWKLMETHFSIDYKGIHNNIVPAKTRDYNAFTFVRNPYDRAISIWNSFFFTYKSDNPIHKRNGLRYRKTFLAEVGSDSFEDFSDYLANLPVKNPNPKVLNNQSNYHKKTNLTNLKFFKLETISDTLPNYIKDLTGVEITIPHELKRNHSKWQELKNERIQRNILTWAREDFERFNYVI